MTIAETDAKPALEVVVVEAAAADQLHPRMDLVEAMVDIPARARRLEGVVQHGATAAQLVSIVAVDVKQALGHVVEIEGSTDYDRATHLRNETWRNYI